MNIKSHLLQEALNYLDINDVRTRENSTSLEAQLLNLATAELESLILRANRETGQNLQNVPINVDNRGVYYGGRVPDASVPASGKFYNVVGQEGSSYRTLVPFDDILPVPKRLEVLSSPVAISEPILFTMIGIGDDHNQVFAVQYATPGTLPTPNVLTVWLDQLGYERTVVTVTITGEVEPQPAWVAERATISESFNITEEGYGASRNRWAVIEKVAVRGLPTGARLRGWSLPFNLPASPDLARPYTNTTDRDVTFARYWQISNDNGHLYEMYHNGGVGSFEIVNNYRLSDTLMDVAVEPNTNGIFAVSPTSLYYADRREYYPDLSKTGLPAEPLYGLQVTLDLTQVGITPYVLLSGVPNANSGNIIQYRYTVNGTNSILPNGALGPITSGWRAGAPEPVSFPLLIVQDYQFRLETQDGNGTITYDLVPWHNAELTPLSSLDITGLIDVVKGMCIDSYGTLWLWNGSFAIPIKIHYDAYIFDANNNYIYVTDSYDNLQVT